MINLNNDQAYHEISAYLNKDPSLGRCQLSKLTGYSDKICRLRKKKWIEQNSRFSPTNYKFPPLSSNPGVKTILVINDLHIPFQHNQALKIVHTVASLCDPNVIILNGDITDCYELGAYTHFRKESLKDELKQLNTYLRYLRDKHHTSEMIYIAGNHEHRWNKMIHRNLPQMADLGISSFPSAIGLHELNIKWIYSNQAESYYQVPGTNLFVGHFDKVAKFSAYTVKNLIEDKHVNIIQGHTHRMGTYYKTTLEKTLVGYENGCLRTLINTEYINDPNWQLGFSIIYVWNDGTFQVKPFHIVETPKYLFTVYNNMKIESPLS